MSEEDQQAEVVPGDGERARASRGLRGWYAHRLGQAMAASERHVLDEVLSELFGYFLVQVGATTDDYLLGASVIRHQIVIDDLRPGGQTGDESGRLRGIYGHAGVLPLQSDSVDVVLLPHTLDFEAVPHDVLREVERALLPEGHVVIMGFNPWSLWGMRRLFTWRRRRRQPPWHGTFRSIMRIKDWLALLGFDVVATRSCFFRPPLRHPGLMRRLLWMERLGGRWWPYRGGTYIIVARKRVVTLTPIKPRWRPRRSLIHGDAIKPTT